MVLKLKLISGFLCSGLLVCSSVVFAQNTSSSEQAETNTSEIAELVPGANLYIYRKHAEPTAWSPTIKIDGKKLVALGNRHYTATQLAPGNYQIKLIWPFLSGQRNAEMEVTIADGETRYVEVTGVSQLAGAGYQSYYFNMGSGIADVKPEHAQATIAECCEFKAPK